MLAILSGAAAAVLMPFAVAEQAVAAKANDAGPEKVVGIGGFFFRAKEPKVPAQWYLDHLGVSKIPMKHGEKPWEQEAGATAFAPFSEKSDYFDVSKGWMLNFRVHDLDRMVAQLQAAGIEVKVDPTAYPNGRFAHLHDPEGNPLELWQPA